MEPTHQSLFLICNHIFHKIEKYVQGKDVVVVIGDTGAGKSTLMASLVYGSDMLEQKEFKR